MHNEIQTDHLPLMLKKIIQTLNAYCSKMNNQDLMKSILLCSNILKNVRLLHKLTLKFYSSEA